MKFATKGIHIGEEPNLKEGASGDVITPLHLSTTFARKNVEVPTGGYEYSRSLNPTRKALESKLAAIENAGYGLAFASGLAAETTLLLSLVKSGDHVVTTDDLYGGSLRLFRKVFAQNYNIEFSFVDTSEPTHVREAITDKTRLIWIETPTNPLLKLSDIGQIAAIAKEHNIILAVDNTFMSPYFQNPLDLGADLSMHSTSKYINGHSDSIGGAIMVNRGDLYEKLKFMQKSAGGIMSPFDSYMVLRGIKSLSLRMRQHEYNAIRIAEFLSTHPRVKRIIYPGLTTHKQHELAKKQMKGYGGMLAVELKGDLEDAKRFLSHLNYFSLAESLGGVESLIELPALMTHGSVPPGERQKLGITDTLIRVSAGIEETEDLIEDLGNALDT